MSAPLFDLPTTEPPAPPASGPWWLQHYELTRGAPAGLNSGKTYPRWCTCSRLVLTGMDHPKVGQLVAVDPYRATPTQEAAAVILTRNTYELLGHVGKWEIAPRHEANVPGSIAHPPANERVVVIEHECGTPPLATEPLATRPPRTTVNYDGPIPF